MRRFTRIFASLVLALVLLTGIAVFQPVAGEGAERGISFLATYPEVVVPIDQSNVEISLTVANTGKATETVLIAVVSAPAGWQYQFEAGYPKAIVRAVSLPPKEMEEFKASQEVTLKLTPPTDAKPGDYKFTLKAVTADKTMESSLDVTVGLSGEAVAPGAEELTLTADYPLLEGAAGSPFEFKVTMKNDAAEDRTVELGATLPARWSVYYTPGYQDDRIRALPLKAGTSQTVTLHLTQPAYVEAGEYPLTFSATTETTSKTIDLKAIVTGTYEIALNTAVGDVPGLLNGRATAGKPAPISLFIGNTGSAPIEDISFSAVKPEGWTITFNPEKLDSLAPDTAKQIDVAIQPASKTIAGDYSITLVASGDQASETLNFRVTVETPTTWGWVGVAIVIIVIAALVGIFARLRRR